MYIKTVYRKKDLLRDGDEKLWLKLSMSLTSITVMSLYLSIWKML